MLGKMFRPRGIGSGSLLGTALFTGMMEVGDSLFTNQTSVERDPADAALSMMMQEKIDIWDFEKVFDAKCLHGDFCG